MIPQVPKVVRLAALLDRNRDQIAAAWGRVVRDLPGTRYGDYTPETILSWTRKGVAVMIDSLASGSAESTETYLRDVALTRLGLGFGIGEVLQGFWSLKDVVVPVVQAAYEPDSEELQQSLTFVDSYLRQLVGRFGQLYTELVTRDLFQQQKRTATMLQAVKTVSSSLELRKVLQWMVEHSAALFGLGCTLSLANPDRGTLSPTVAAGYPDHRPIHTAPLAGGPLLDELMVHQRPLASYDASADPRFGKEIVHALDLKSTLVAPIIANGQLLGVLTCSTLDGHRTFVGEDIDLVEGLVHAAGLAIQNAQLYEQTRQRLAEMQSLQRVTAALLQDLTLDETLEIVCREAMQLTQATGSTLLLVEDQIWLRPAHATGSPTITVDRLPLAQSFSLRAMQSAKPVLSNDPVDLSGAFYQSAPDLESLLVVPLVLGDEVLGALHLANTPGGFSEDAVRIMTLFGDGAAIAIESARLREQAEQLAVIEERQRLARELHDSVTQALYSVTLYAEAARMALASGKQDVALNNLQELHTMAREAMLDMRMLIFELHPPLLKEEGLVIALQVRLASVESRAGLATDLRVTGDYRLPLAIEEELFWIAVEAFNNIVKHAHASRVTVDLVLQERSVRLVIGDDGRGYDVAAVEDRGGVGLRGIRERVRRIGGVLKMESAPGQGTKLQVEASF